MIKRLLVTFGIVILIGSIASAIIIYARGYRLDFRQKAITPTGVLSASSYPDKASILIDNQLVSATNASISLPPGWYQVRINKEGYQSWEKKVRIQGEVVAQIDALLIPINPSFRALTVTGLLSPTLSPSGTKVAYIIPDEEAATSATSAASQVKTGVWILELRTGPLGAKIGPRQIFRATSKLPNQYDWPNARLFWSPDEKQIVLAFIKKEKNKEAVTSVLLIDLDRETSVSLETTTSLPNLLSEWKSATKEKESLFLDSLSASLSAHLRNNVTNIRLSLDETKILYLATVSANLASIITPPLIGSNPTTEARTITSGKFYIYDIKEDKNFFTLEQKAVTSTDMPLWYSDSKHIVMIEKDTIYIMDYDGTNKRAVYAGSFEANVLFPWPGGEKLVILTHLNRPKTLPNLYEIDLR